MPLELALTEITRGEAVTISVPWLAPLPIPPSAVAASYRMGFASTRNGSDLLSVTFGPADYTDTAWEFTLSAAQTLSLPVGTIVVGVWDANGPVAMEGHLISVTNLPGRPV